MKVYGFILLLCLSMIFIPWHIEAQATSSSKTLETETVPVTSSLNATSSNATLSKTLTESVTATSSSNNTSLANSTISEQDRQLLEKQFFIAGNDLFDQSNYTGAISFYDQALEINSTDINVLYNKALALDDLGKLDEAVTYYSKVLAIKPDDTDTLTNLGLALDSLGKHAQAITYYDKVLAINPDNIDALYNKGLALEGLGLKNNATSYYKKVVAINPNVTAALNKLNLTYNNANNSVLAGIQKTDQTLLIYVGIFVAVLIGLIVINLVARRKRPASPATAPTKDEPTEIEKPQDKKPKPKDTEEDDGWKGL